MKTPGAILNPHLTRPQGDEMAERQRITVPGMAHWAATGPAGVTCRECAFWGSSRYFRRGEDGSLRPRRCALFPTLAGGNKGAGVDHDCLSCRYFRPGERVPPVDKVKERLTPE